MAEDVMTRLHPSHELMAVAPMVTPADARSKIQGWSNELTMTNINDIGDLVQILQDHPEWRNTVRGLIVGEELGDLPKALDTFTQVTNENFNLVHQRLETLESNLANFISATNDNFKLANRFLEKLDTNVTTLNRDMAQVRGSHARNETIKNAEDIAMEMDVEFVRVLTIADLRRMTQKEPNVVPDDKLKSFLQADLVIEGKVGNTTHYNVVEISFTGQENDAERASRNARFINHLTGCPAQPIIASVKNAPSLNNRIDSGRLFWYQIASRDLEPD